MGCGIGPQPSLRDSRTFGVQPSVETLGYSRLSLRDSKAAVFPCRQKPDPEPTAAQTLRLAGGMKFSRQLFLRLVGHVHFRRADVLDLDGGGAIYVNVVSVEVDRALHFEFILREHAVFDPEFHRAFGIAGCGCVADSRPVPDSAQYFRSF